MVISFVGGTDDRLPALLLCSHGMRQGPATGNVIYGSHTLLRQRLIFGADRFK